MQQYNLFFRCSNYITANVNAENEQAAITMVQTELKKQFAFVEHLGLTDGEICDRVAPIIEHIIPQEELPNGTEEVFSS